MKARGLFLSALFMGAVMAGCSSEEVLNNENEKSLKKSDNYIAVNIVAPTDVMSRGTEGDFAAGSDAENAVSDAWFVFYNANGGYVDAVKGENMEWNEGTGSVEKISTAIIVLSNPQTWPTQVVALLNTGMQQTDFANLNLTNLKNKVDDYSEGFVMSNSVYKNGNDIVTTTPLLDTQICDSEAKALQNPVSIPVERVLAKVEADIASDGLEVIAPDVTPQLNGEDVTFVPTITGMKLVDTNPVSYLMKNIDNVTGWEGWTDATNWRSYWANSAATTNYGSSSYSEIASKGEVDGYSAYCHENTSGTPTKLLVTAQFKAEDAADYETVIKYNGTYYTVDGLKNLLNKEYFASIKYGEDNSNDWRPYMTFVSAETDNEWEVKLALKGAPEAEGISDLVTTINNKTMSQWTDGKCYYYVNVEHFGPDAYGVGIVRNHWYQITLNSIKGLGTPVFDPTKEIDPDRPEEENYYLSAEVKILKWKVVSQSVDLE